MKNLIFISSLFVIIATGTTYAMESATFTYDKGLCTQGCEGIVLRNLNLSSQSQIDYRLTENTNNQAKAVIAVLTKFLTKDQEPQWQAPQTNNQSNLSQTFITTQNTQNSLIIEKAQPETKQLKAQTVQGVNKVTHHQMNGQQQTNVINQNLHNNKIIELKQQVCILDHQINMGIFALQRLRQSLKMHGYLDEYIDVLEQPSKYHLSLKSFERDQLKIALAQLQ